jgi:pimeloyl-ACP methyl ester carboxylesterase
LPLVRRTTPQPADRSLGARIGRFAVRFTITLVAIPLLLVLGACVLMPSRAPFDVQGATKTTLELSQPPYELAVWESGAAAGVRVIYVHGTPGSARSFRHYLRDPIDGTRSVAYDRPGFGETEPNDSLVSFEAQARAIEPLLEPSDNGHWPVLVGHSLGGPIIARAAADFPERIGALVILSGSLDPALEKPQWFNYAADFPLIRPFIGSAMRHANDEIMAAREQTEALDEVIQRVRCPVVIVHGTEDSLVPYENVAYMREAFGNAASVEVIPLDGQGHFIPWTHELEIRSAIRSALHAMGVSILAHEKPRPANRRNGATRS